MDFDQAVETAARASKPLLWDESVTLDDNMREKLKFIERSRAATTLKAVGWYPENAVKAKGLREFAESHRLPFIIFRDSDNTAVYLGEYMHEVADELEARR